MYVCMYARGDAPLHKIVNTALSQATLLSASGTAAKLYDLTHRLRYHGR